MKASILGCVVLLNSSLLAACGGVSNIGSGDGGKPNSAVGGFEASAGDDGDAAGNASNAGGGSGAATAGGTDSTGNGGSRPMGGRSSVGGSGTLPVAGAGGAASVHSCKVDLECVGIGDGCEPCPDGGFSCNSSCVNGECVAKPGKCPATCKYDAQCPVHDAACISCEDGEHCPTSTCQMGICRGAKPACGIAEDCTGLPCSVPCKLCDSSGVCAPDYTSFCDDEGKCAPLPTQCGVSKCMTKSDCGTPPPVCTPCNDGSCASFDCLSNQCTLTCGNSSPICKYTDECASLGLECKLCPSGKCAVPACLSNACVLVCPL